MRMKNKILSALIFCLLNSMAQAHDLFAKAHQLVGSKNQPVLITDSHGVRLYNGADYGVDLSYHYKLCVQDAKCKQIDMPIHLDPHSGVQPGGWTNQMPLQIQWRWNYAGSHQITSETWIEGEGADHVYDYNVITIY